MNDYRGNVDEAYKAFENSKTKDGKFLNFINWRLSDCEATIVDNALIKNKGWEQRIEIFAQVHKILEEVKNLYLEIHHPKNSDIGIDIQDIIEYHNRKES